MPKIKKTAKAAIDSHAAAGESGAKHIFVLMDESGSMRGLEEAVTTGCNEFIHKFSEDPDARIWLAWFDQSPGSPRTRLQVKGVVAKDVEQLKPSDYNPRGMTPLNDAIADSVAMLDAAAGDDEVVFLAVITDGMENASEHSTASIRELLVQREELGWGIVFIGANQDSHETAAEFGMHRRGRAFNFNADPVGVKSTMHAVSTLASERAKYGTGRSGRERYDESAAALHDLTDGDL